MNLGQEDHGDEGRGVFGRGFLVQLHRRHPREGLRPSGDLVDRTFRVQASIGTDDESEIVVNDVATVTVRLLSCLATALPQLTAPWQALGGSGKHLAKDEALGPVHAPFFPNAKLEEWWFFLVDPGPATHRKPRNNAEEPRKTKKQLVLRL